MAASPRAMSGCVMHSDLFCRLALPTRLNSNRMYTLFTILSTKMKSAPTRRSGRRYLSVADRLNDGDHNHYNAAQNKQRPDHRSDQRIPPTLISVFHLAEAKQQKEGEGDSKSPTKEHSFPQSPCGFFCFLLRRSVAEGDESLPMFRSHVLPAPDIDAEVAFGGVEEDLKLRGGDDLGAVRAVVGMGGGDQRLDRRRFSLGFPLLLACRPSLTHAIRSRPGLPIEVPPVRLWHRHIGVSTEDLDRHLGSQTTVDSAERRVPQ